LEGISCLSEEKEFGNERLEQSIVCLLSDYKRENGFKSLQTKDLTFVDNKVRIEILLSEESKLDALRDFNENIEVKSSHNNGLVQVLVPINLIEQLSNQKFVRYIRRPIDYQSPVINEEFTSNAEQNSDICYEEMNITLQSNAYNIETKEGIDWIKMEGFYLSSSPGNPQLPQKIVNVIVDPDAEIPEIRMELQSAQTKELPGVYVIAPAPPLVTYTNGSFIYDYGDNKKIIERENLLVFNNDMYFPDSCVEIVNLREIENAKGINN